MTLQKLERMVPVGLRDRDPAQGLSTQFLYLLYTTTYLRYR